MKWAGHTYHTILEYCGWATALGIGTTALLVTFDIIMRNTPFGAQIWVIEVVEYMLFFTTFLGAPWVLHRSAHVRVDIVLLVLPPRGRRYLEILTDLIGFALSLILFYAGYRAAAEAFIRDAFIYKNLVVAEWPLLAVIPFASLLLAVEFILRLRRSARGEDIEVGADAIREGF